MISIYYSLVFLIPSLVLSQKCPSFQAVIPLRASATSSNFSFAIVANGRYYLAKTRDQNLKQLNSTGVMPKGFEESRLITLIDKIDCNESQYYLIAIKSFRYHDLVQNRYSTLDLLNWNQSTKWSEPKLLREHSLFSNDPYIKLFTQFDPNVDIEAFIHMIFYWPQKKTLFVVTKPFQKSSQPVKSSSLRYYSVGTERGCEDDYTYSKGSEKLSSALNSVIDPLDLCFFSHPSPLTDSLLYCVGGTSFQANAVVHPFQNGSLRTENIGSPENMPTIDRLKLIGTLCSKEKRLGGLPVNNRIRVRIDERIGGEELPPEMDNELMKQNKERAEHREVPQKQDIPQSMTTTAVVVSSPVTESEDSSSTFVIIIVCLAVFVVIMIGILIIAARRHQRIAKM